jgi:hypothetical protein
MLPSIIAYQHGNYLISITLNHWRCPHMNSLSRKIDLIVSRLLFIIMFIYYAIYIKLSHVPITVSIMCIAVYCFYKSHLCFCFNTSEWRNYHLLFHIFCICNACIIV